MFLFFYLDRLKERMAIKVCAQQIIIVPPFINTVRNPQSAIELPEHLPPFLDAHAGRAHTIASDIPSIFLTNERSKNSSSVTTIWNLT